MRYPFRLARVARSARVERVEPAPCRSITAGSADRQGEPDAAEHHRAIPVGSSSEPGVSPPFVSQQIEELVDRGLLLYCAIRHFNARGTVERASRGSPV